MSETTTQKLEAHCTKWSQNSFTCIWGKNGRITSISSFFLSFFHKCSVGGVELIIADRLIFTRNMRSKQKRAGTERLSILNTSRLHRPQLLLRYYFRLLQSVPTSWKPTTGTLQTLSIGKTFSLHMPVICLAGEPCLCYGAVVARNNEVSQTSSIPSYFECFRDFL